MSISIQRLAPRAALLVAASATLAACAMEPKPGATPRQCFWANNVHGFSSIDDTTVNLRVGVKDVYQLELFAPCHDIDWSNQIALEARGGSWICSGLDATIIAPSTLGPQRCQVRTIRKLTPEEIKAIPPKDKP